MSGRIICEELVVPIVAKRATAEVVKCSNNPPLSNCIYPLMQVLVADRDSGGLITDRMYVNS